MGPPEKGGGDIGPGNPSRGSRAVPEAKATGPSINGDPKGDTPHTQMKI